MADILPFRPKRDGGGQSTTQAESQESAIALFNQLRKQAEVARVNHQAAASELNSEANKTKRPSFFIYFLLYYAAAVADLLSFAEKPIEATGVGEIPVFLINLIISALFFLAGIWLNRKIKNVRLTGKQMLQVSERAAQRVSQYRQWTAATLKAIRGSGVGRRFLRSKTGRGVVKATAQLARVTRFPLFRNAAAVIAEVVPILDLVPWYSLNIYWTHRDHRQEYKTSQINMATATDSLVAEGAELNDLNSSLADLKNIIEEEGKAA